jgi:hypothetical protein
MVSVLLYYCAVTFIPLTEASRHNYQKFYSIGSQGPMLWNFLPLQFVNDRKKLEFLSLAGLFSLVWRLAPALPCNIRLGWKGLPG